MARRGSLPWREDPAIMARLAKVERAHLRGNSQRDIGAALGVDEKTIRNDLDRIHELWKDRVTGELETLKAQAIAELDDVRQRALAAAEFDEQAERAVLYGDSVDDDEATDLQGRSFKNRVVRDFKGSASFKGNKSGALNTARQASMDKAKVLGIIVDRQEHEGQILIRRYEGVDVDNV
jgi:hypothetical protein